MKTKTIYLCGPINGRSDDDCRNWRESFKSRWSGSTLDPMRRDYRGRESESTDEIVEGDIEDIQNSGALVVFFDKPSVGTSMEVFYAKHVLKMPVVVINAATGPLSPWLVYHADAVVESVLQAVETLERLDD